MLSKTYLEELKNDFSFVKDYGFCHLFDECSGYGGYRFSYIVFERKQYKLYIYFRHMTSKFSLSLSDYTKRKFPSKEEIYKIAKFAPKKLDQFSKGQIAITNITNGIIFHGDSYKDQVDQVREYLHDYLEMHKELYVKAIE